MREANVDDFLRLEYHHFDAASCLSSFEAIAPVRESVVTQLPTSSKP